MSCQCKAIGCERKGGRDAEGQDRKPRENLTKEERERLDKYGSIEFKSAGAKNQR
jgi:hypothetical protein